MVTERSTCVHKNPKNICLRVYLKKVRTILSVVLDVLRRNPKHLQPPTNDQSLILFPLHKQE